MRCLIESARRRPETNPFSSTNFSMVNLLVLRLSARNGPGRGSLFSFSLSFSRFPTPRGWAQLSGRLDGFLSSFGLAREA